jgi:hypothetical protein
MAGGFRNRKCIGDGLSIGQQDDMMLLALKINE